MSSSHASNGKTSVRQLLDIGKAPNRDIQPYSPDEEDTVAETFIILCDDSLKQTNKLSPRILKTNSVHTLQIAFRVSEDEKQHLIKQGILENVRSLSNLIRIRCGLSPL